MGYGGIDVDDLNEARAERDAARAQLAEVTRERDEARVKVAGLTIPKGALNVTIDELEERLRNVPACGNTRRALAELTRYAEALGGA